MLKSKNKRICKPIAGFTNFDVYAFIIDVDVQDFNSFLVRQFRRIEQAIAQNFLDACLLRVYQLHLLILCIDRIRFCEIRL